MKCIHCGNDSKYPQRPGRECPKCHQKFVFEPREGDSVTDMLFQNAIKSVSADGQLRRGVEHLYYEVCRRKKGKAAPIGCVAVFLFLAAFLFTLAARFNAPPFAIFGGLFAVTFLVVLATRLADRM